MRKDAMGSKQLSIVQGHIVLAVIGVVVAALPGRAFAQAPNSDSVFCATENSTCTVPGTADVWFGATDGTNGGYTVLTGVPNGIGCNVAAFGGFDPWPGHVKACYYDRKAGPDGWNWCANEGGTCNHSGWIAYGHKNRDQYANGFILKYFTSNSNLCNTSYFGGNDPAQNVFKACFWLDGSLGGFQYCSEENQTCGTAVNGGYEIADVAYGPYGGPYFMFTELEVPVACSNDSFPYDPAPGVVKQCLITYQSGPGGKTVCAPYGGSCLPNPGTFLFGGSGHFISRPYGYRGCWPSAFGWDPNQGYPKSCFYE